MVKSYCITTVYKWYAHSVWNADCIRFDSVFKQTVLAVLAADMKGHHMKELNFPWTCLISRDIWRHSPIANAFPLLFSLAMPVVTSCLFPLSIRHTADHILESRTVHNSVAISFHISFVCVYLNPYQLKDHRRMSAEMPGQSCNTRKYSKSMWMPVDLNTD